MQEEIAVLTERCTALSEAAKSNEAESAVEKITVVEHA